VARPRSCLPPSPRPPKRPVWRLAPDHVGYSAFIGRVCLGGQKIGHRYLIAVALAAGLVGLSSAVSEATAVRGVHPPGTGVLATPDTGTPEFDPSDDDPVEEIRQLVQCGGTMYAVGSFSQILHGAGTYDRSNLFSFSATPPFTVTAWTPKVNGTVNSITFRKNDCSEAYIGGQFSSVNGIRVANIAEISTTKGGVVPSFAHRASGEVETLVAIPHHILVGGYFKSINGSSADPFMASLNPRTGKDDGFLRLHISGHYVYPRAAPNRTKVYNQQLSHDGRFDLVMGDFTSVARKPRRQILMLNVAGRSAKLTGWTSPEFHAYCAPLDPFYIRAASWSPDDSTIYTADTGFEPEGDTRQHPREGLCDAATAFPSTHASVRHKWINYTGCDSLYATAADASTAYFGGHERWSMNRHGCNREGKGAYPAPGMEGVSPAKGALYTVRSSSGIEGYYSRARGKGADDMLITAAGLWIASDNAFGSQSCGGVRGLSGICLLPYGSSGNRRRMPRPQDQ
jgi:hypothetical protein